MSGYISLSSYSPHGDGVTDDTSIVQSAINAASSAGKALYIDPPSVSYYLNSVVLTVPSNMRIFGDGPRSLFKVGPSLVVSTLFPGGLYVAFINSTPSTGNNKIFFESIAIDATNSPSNVAHCIHMRNVLEDSVTNCHFIGGNDAVSHTRSSNFTILNNWCYSQTNGAIDCWDSCTDGTIASNHIVGNNILPYGVLATGIAGDGTMGTTQRIKIIGNEISDVLSIGIWAQGGVVGAVTGISKNNVIIGNTVKGSGGIGARVSDGNGNIISNNLFEDTHTFGIHLTSESSGCAYDNIVSNNQVHNASNSAHGVNCAIAVQATGSHHNLISNNRIVGSNHLSGIELYPTSFSNVATDNVIDVGTDGSYFNNYSKTNYCTQIVNNTIAQV